MKKLLVIPALAILVGCGGGGSAPKDIGVDASKLIDGKTFYEATECKDPNYYTHKISKNGYIQTSYSDSNFTDYVSRKSYSVKTFSKDDITLVKNNIEYLCDVDYEYDTDKNEITKLGLNCTSEKPDSEDVFFMAAYPTKELAVKNKDTDCQ